MTRAQASRIVLLLKRAVGNPLFDLADILGDGMIANRVLKAISDGCRKSPRPARVLAAYLPTQPNLFADMMVKSWRCEWNDVRVIHKTQSLRCQITIKPLEASQADGWRGERDDGVKRLVASALISRAELDRKQQRQSATHGMAGDDDPFFKKTMLFQMAENGVETSQSGCLVSIVKRALKAAMDTDRFLKIAITQGHGESFEVGDRPVDRLARTPEGNRGISVIPEDATIAPVVGAMYDLLIGERFTF